MSFVQSEIDKFDHFYSHSRLFYPFINYSYLHIVHSSSESNCSAVSKMIEGKHRNKIMKYRKN